MMFKNALALFIVVRS